MATGGYPRPSQTRRIGGRMPQTGAKAVARWRSEPRRRTPRAKRATVAKNAPDSRAASAQTARGEVDAPEGNLAIGEGAGREPPRRLREGKRGWRVLRHTLTGTKTTQDSTGKASAHTGPASPADSQATPHDRHTTRAVSAPARGQARLARSSRGCLRTLRVRLRRICPPLRFGAFHADWHQDGTSKHTQAHAPDSQNPG